MHLRLRLGLDFEKISFSSPLCFSAMSQIALGSKSSRHTCGLVVSGSTTICHNRSLLRHLVYLSGLTTTDSSYPLALCHVSWRPIQWLIHSLIHAFIYSLSPPISLYPSLRHICPQPDRIHFDSPLSRSLPWGSRRAALTRSLHAVLNKQTPHSPSNSLPGGYPPWYLWKSYTFSLIEVEGWCPPSQVPNKAI